MPDTKRYASVKVLTLAVDLSSTDTVIKTTSNKGWDGEPITASMFNTDYIPATLINDAKTKIEFVLIDASTIENLTTTGAVLYKRGLKHYAQGNAADNDEVASLKLSWREGETKVLIGTNPPWMYGRFANKDNDEIILNTWTFTDPNIPKMDAYSAPTNDLQFATKKYVDDTTTGTTNVDRIQVEAIAGETLSAGDIVYLDETNGRWKKASALASATSENVLLGVSQGVANNGGIIPGGVLTEGIDRNQTGLTAGDLLYLSDTAGEVTNSAGTKNVIVGYAINATEMYLFPHFKRFLTKDQQDALAGTSGIPSSTNKYVTENDTTNAETITDTSIAFVSATSTITDSNNGLAGFRVGASITVSGSVNNDGTYTITAVTPGAITVAEALTDESAGASVTISAVTAGKVIRANSSGSYPVLPGLARAAQIDIFDANGIWTKPKNAKVIFVQLWGGGGSGAAGNPGYPGDLGSGGGGGGYNQAWFDANDLGDTETIIVGAGGPAVTSGQHGVAGGVSSFGTHVYAYGGGGGKQGSITTGGGGGGQLSAGDNGEYATTTPYAYGGEPNKFEGLSYNDPVSSQTNIDYFGSLKNATFNGGAGGCNNQNALYLGVPLANGGSSIYGGGGGGGGSRDDSLVSVGGGSVWGGAGGAGANSDLNILATAGAIPGGGGGGGANGPSGPLQTSGAGARGEVRVFTFF